MAIRENAVAAEICPATQNMSYGEYITYEVKFYFILQKKKKGSNFPKRVNQCT